FPRKPNEAEVGHHRPFRGAEGGVSAGALRDGFHVLGQHSLEEFEAILSGDPEKISKRQSPHRGGGVGRAVFFFRCAVIGHVANSYSAETTAGGIISASASFAAAPGPN